MTAECRLKSVVYLESVRHASSLPCPFCIQPDHVRDQTFVARAEESKHVQDACNCTRRVRTSAEAMREHFVSILINAHQVPVGVADISQQPRSECQPHHYRPSLTDLIVSAWCAHRANTRMVIPDLVDSVDDQSTVELHNVRITVAKLVSCSVATNHDIFRHGVRSIVRSIACAKILSVRTCHCGADFILSWCLGSVEKILPRCTPRVPRQRSLKK